MAVCKPAAPRPHGMTMDYRAMRSGATGAAQLLLPGLGSDGPRCPNCGSSVKECHYPDFSGDVYLVCPGCGSEGWQTAHQGTTWFAGIPRGGG